MGIQTSDSAGEMPCAGACSRATPARGRRRLRVAAAFGAGLLAGVAATSWAVPEERTAPAGDVAQSAYTWEPEPLPREWRWEPAVVRFEGMIRER